MSCSSLYNKSCPEPVTTITISQTFLTLGGTTAIIEDYSETLTVDTVSVTLPYAPITGYAIEVYVNGLRQKLTDDYSISGTSGTIITFVNTLGSGDVVVVHYAHETA